jgi:hypothetical protein
MLQEIAQDIKGLGLQMDVFTFAAKLALALIKMK